MDDLEGVEAQIAELERQIAQKRAEAARLRAGLEGVRGLDLSRRSRRTFGRGLIWGALASALLLLAALVWIATSGS